MDEIKRVMRTLKIPIKKILVSNILMYGNDLFVLLLFRHKFVLKSGFILHKFLYKAFFF